MKIRLIMIFVFCQIIAGCQNDASVEKSEYTDMEGYSGNFSDHKGKWMVINYWATWCKPCIEEIPELNTFSAKHIDQIKLFAVDFDNAQGEKLVESTKKMGIEFSVLTQDPHSILGFEKPYALPTTFIFNPEGKLHKTLLGPQTEKSLLNALEMTK